jgi:hypothetical protein
MTIVVLKPTGIHHSEIGGVVKRRGTGPFGLIYEFVHLGSALTRNCEYNLVANPRISEGMRNEQAEFFASHEHDKCFRGDFETRHRVIRKAEILFETEAFVKTRGIDKVRNRKVDKGQTRHVDVLCSMYLYAA